MTGVEKSPAADVWIAAVSGLVGVVILPLTIQGILTAGNNAGKHSFFS
jgi:hypothetical protein